MIKTGRPIIANIERLHEFMDRNNLSAVVARSGQNFTYLSGIAYPGTLARHLELTDSTRGVMLLWPRQGEPVIVLNKIAKRLTLRDSWIKRAEIYEAYIESPYSCLCKVIKDTGLDGERIGFEKKYVSAAHWEEVQRLLPRLRMVDCSQMMDEVRWIKTSEEIALLKKGADLLDGAYLEVFPTVRQGDTERAIHTRLISSCLRRGANWAHGILNSSRNDVPYGGESDTVLYKGDVIRTDYVAYLQGYPGHQSRNAILGKPSIEQQRDYQIYRDIYRKTIDRCRPGSKIGDIFKFVVDEFKKHGWEFKSASGLIGHSVGPWWHQQEPILTRGSNIVLEQGMVLALEPRRDYWHIQDMVAVRSDGPELISDKFSTDQMFVIDL
ncbi:MAG: M24 family metallopeptidase [Planctomycetota bacterium]|jgi:Xaa-Pro aminopeptidase